MRMWARLVLTTIMLWTLALPATAAVATRSPKMQAVGSWELSTNSSTLLLDIHPDGSFSVRSQGSVVQQGIAVYKDRLWVFGANDFYKSLGPNRLMTVNMAHTGISVWGRVGSTHP